mmetsp:Transcript_29072/g.43935  ORF Transcript_29072/g.43935 Transcript_29072/m.43935 type:complete len:632 (+) Transcript_29072:82-1977(+)
MPLLRRTSHTFLDVAIKDDDLDRSQRSDSCDMSMSSSRQSFVGRNKNDATAWRSKGTSSNNSRSRCQSPSLGSVVSDNSRHHNRRPLPPNICTDQSVSSIPPRMITSRGDFDDDRSVVTAATAAGYSFHSMPHQRQLPIPEMDCKSAPFENVTPDLTGSVLDCSAGISNTTTIQQNTFASEEQEEKQPEEFQGESSEDEVKELLHELEKLKMEFAEAQSQVDWYKLRYRHLHTEFTDLQAFCKQLQTENIELRNENVSLKGKTSKKHEPWFKMDRFTRLNKPKHLEPGDDWDTDTFTTQHTLTTKSSRDVSCRGGGNPPFDKPNDIIVTTKNTENDNNQSENTAKGMTPASSDANLTLREEEESKDTSQEESNEVEVNSTNASIDEEDKHQETKNTEDETNFLIPSEVDAAPQKQDRNATFIQKHRFLPRRGSLLGNIAENLVERRGSITSLFTQNNSDGMEDMNLNDFMQFHESVVLTDEIEDTDCNHARATEETIPESSDFSSAAFEQKPEDENDGQVVKKTDEKKGRWKFPWEKEKVQDENVGNGEKNDGFYEKLPDARDEKVPVATEENSESDEKSDGSERDVVFDLPTIRRNSLLEHCNRSYTDSSSTTSSSTAEMPQDLSEQAAL